MSILKTVVQRTLPKTVYIHVYRTDEDILEGGEQGSGFIYTADGYIITNAHVVRGGEGYAVELHDGTLLPARLVGASRIADVAVLKIDPKTPLDPVVFADEQDAEVGDPVFAVGMPISERLKRTVTMGRISHPMRFCPWENAGPIPMVQADLTLAKGNSGGGLFNSKGHLVGVNTFILDAVGLSSGYVFAMRAADVQWVANRIIEKGYGPWKYRFGASLKKATTGMARAHGFTQPKGVLANSIAEGSLADRLGLKAGDLVLKIGDIRTACAMAAIYALMRHEGVHTTILVSRVGHGVFEVPLYLPKRGKYRKVKPDHKMFDVFGMAYRRVNGPGVEVKAVRPGSPAAVEGFLGGEVILAVQDPKTGKWHKPKTIKELRELLRKYAKRGTMLLVDDCDEKVYLALSL